MVDRMMKTGKKVVIALLCAILLNLFYAKQNNADALGVTTKYAVAYDATTEEFLYTKNPNKKANPASLTKLMSAYVAIKKIKNLNEKVKLKDIDIKKAKKRGLTRTKLPPNTQLTYRDLLYYALISSSGDASYALARLTYKSDKKFVKAMNQNAKKLKMDSTFFTNCTGYTSNAHKSTCKDLIKLMNVVWKNKTLKKILTSKSYKTSTGKKLKNKSKTYSDFCIACKNGYTSAASQCLMSYESINKHTIYIVLMQAATKNKLIKDEDILSTYIDLKYQKNSRVKAGVYPIKKKATVRKKASIKSNTSYKLLKGTRVTVRKIDGNWCYISYKGRYGYLESDYIF